MKIGVLALQGDFSEHMVMLQRLGVATAQVRLPTHLDGLDGLILPGGESTTIGKLAVDFGLMEPLRNFGKSRAIWGTCAGAILLSKNPPLVGIHYAKSRQGQQPGEFCRGLLRGWLIGSASSGRSETFVKLAAALAQVIQERY